MRWIAKHMKRTTDSRPALLLRTKTVSLTMGEQMIKVLIVGVVAVVLIFLVVLGADPNRALERVPAVALAGKHGTTTHLETSPVQDRERKAAASGR
jgi:hypothetical protein